MSAICIAATVTIWLNQWALSLAIDAAAAVAVAVELSRYYAEFGNDPWT